MTDHAEPMIHVPQPKSVQYSRDIIHCHPYLRERWPKLVYLFHQETGKDLFLTCTWRSVEEQKRLYAQGRTVVGQIVTNIDGMTRLSRHNRYPSEAFDVCVDINPDPVKTLASWDTSLYSALGPICSKLNLVWGGTWEKFRDLPHVELPPEIAADV